MFPSLRESQPQHFHSEPAAFRGRGPPPSARRLHFSICTEFSSDIFSWLSSSLVTGRWSLVTWVTVFPNALNETSTSGYERADRMRFHARLALLHRSRDPRSRKGKNLSPHLATCRHNDAALRGSERREENHRRSRNLFHRRNWRTDPHHPRQTKYPPRLQQRLPPSRGPHRAWQRVQERHALPVSRLDLHARRKTYRHTGRRWRRI